ncbi:MAG: hypothetical protein ACI875_002520, partial [Planctomycetota bacterium]
MIYVRTLIAKKGPPDVQQSPDNPQGEIIP